MQNIQHTLHNIRETITCNFKSATLNFILILLMISGIAAVFGNENMVTGLIAAPLLLSMVSRDLTARPIKHLFIQALLLCLMAAAASLTSILPVPAAFIVHLTTLFIITYFHTYECGDHFYFQYTLGYLFLLFLSPITPDFLPRRLLALIAGSVCMILYQLVKGRGRAADTTREVFGELFDEAECCVSSLLSGKSPAPNSMRLHRNLNSLSKSIHFRRKKTLCISDASCTLIEAAHDMESLILKLCEITPSSASRRTDMLRQISVQISFFHGYLRQEQTDIPSLNQRDFCVNDHTAGEEFYQLLTFIRARLLDLPQPEKRHNYRETSLPLSVRVKVMINANPVRIAYALRLSLLMAICILIVQSFHLAHGKWLLFTIASVSLPYADDVTPKAKNRMIATMIGGMISALAFTLIPSASGRTAVAMLTGYMSFYMNSYVTVFACGTIGALSGAIQTGASGWEAVAAMVLIRFAYIILGIAIALICNCLIAPVKTKNATHLLGKRYIAITKSLSNMHQKENADPQLYYHLLLYMHMLEHKFTQNALALHWDGAEAFIKKHRAVMTVSPAFFEKDTGRLHNS